MTAEGSELRNISDAEARLEQEIEEAEAGAPELAVVVESTKSEEDMRALFREEVKPRLAREAAVGAYNQEV